MLENLSRFFLFKKNGTEIALKAFYSMSDIKRDETGANDINNTDV